jgi:hypothetical protein
MDASILNLRERSLHGTTALLSGLGIELLLKQLASLILPESFISDAVTYANYSLGFSGLQVGNRYRERAKKKNRYTARWRSA